MQWNIRTDRKELLDGEDIPEADLYANLRELNTINTWLGGHRITLAGVRALIPMGRGRPLHICEIGCGGGDNLQAIDRWAGREGIPVRLTGVDLKPACIAFARAKAWQHPTQWITADYRETRFDELPDIVFSSLFCHHFPSAGLPAQLHWMHEQSRLGFFVNDLHRHPLAFHSIRLLTRLFSRSYLVRHDAPLSVQRSFVLREWRQFLKDAGLQGRVRWKWAFRWLIIVKSE